MPVAGGEPRHPEVPDEIAGRLLISTPLIGDSNFDHTVIFVLGHSDDGTLGVTLNRPLDIPVGDAFEQWVDLVSPPDSLFSGGPVETSTLVCVAASEQGGPGFAPIPGPMHFHTMDLDEDPALAVTHVTAMRIFAGYAGWGPHQLAGEIRSGAWFVVDAHASDITTPQPDELWERVLRRQPDSSRWFANYPDDPRAN